jgi:hypothetical protein
MKRVICHREQLAARTHITTNLTSAEIRTRYDERTLSRVLGMCKPFTLEGKDMRAASRSTSNQATLDGLEYMPYVKAAVAKLRAARMRGADAGELLAMHGEIEAEIGPDGLARVKEMA